MQNNISQFKTETMRRVYSIFLMKKLYGRIAIKSYILLALVYIQAKLIFVKAVLTNMPSITDVPAVYHFYSYAFLNTKVAVQMAIIAALVTAIWISRDFLKKNNSFDLIR